MMVAIGPCNGNASCVKSFAVRAPTCQSYPIVDGVHVVEQDADRLNVPIVHRQV